MKQIKNIAKIIAQIKDEKEAQQFLDELLSSSEINVLSKRWRILTLLYQGITQREIAKKLSVSLCNVTRGAKILKNNNAIVRKYLKEDIEND